jgi:hypothetical protein
MSNHSKKLGRVVSIDEAKIHDHVGELVRGTVEETLNAMLDAEADVLCAVFFKIVVAFSVLKPLVVSAPG